MEDTIFVQIAAYRDPELKNTLVDLLSTAKDSSRLKICIAWQHSEEDEWDDLSEYIYDPRFIILDIDYKESKGVCWARNQIQQRYKGETYTLQLDSHHRFIQDWDEELIQMLKNLQKKGHSKPLITTYLPSYFPELEPNGRTGEVWKLDFNRFSPEGYIAVQPSTLVGWQELEEPIPTRFYSAHFAFTIGDFCKEVKHDPEMYFHGEEPSIAVRAYTWGYDLFNPHKIIAWHEYTRNGKKKHWDDASNWPELNNKSHHRYRLLHEMDGLECTPCAKNALGEYYFGEVRTLKDYEKYAGVRFKDRKVQKYTLEGHQPPNPVYLDYESSLIQMFRHCINIHRTHFKESDYDFWVVAFENNDGTVLARLDIGEEEVKQVLRQPNEWLELWREYIGPKPQKWVVWPHSKSKGYVERIEQQL